MINDEFVVGTICTTVNFALVFPNESNLETLSLTAQPAYSVANGTVCVIIGMIDRFDRVKGVYVLLQNGNIGFVLTQFLRLL